MGKSRTICGPCVSKTCKEPLWKDDLLYTGHSQAPVCDSDILGTCCCEKPPEPEPDCCNSCSTCKQKVSFNVFGPTRTLRCGYDKCKKKLAKQNGGICCVL